MWGAGALVRYRVIDFSRSLAAIAVLLEHWALFMLEANWGSYSSETVAQPLPWLLTPMRDYGGFAVQLFWMISGFIFAFVYGRPEIGFGEYCSRRFARLYPLHLVTLLLVASLQFILVALVGTALFIPNNDVWHFVLNLFFIPSLGLENGPSFNSPIWSVAVEVPIYLLFWATVRYLPMNAFVALAIAGLFFLSQDVITFSHVDYCGMLFFVGVAIYYVSNWFTARQCAVLAAMSWVTGLALVLTVPQLALIHTVVLVVIFGPPLALMAALDRIWSGENALLDRMAGFGDLSYSIYLLHMPLLMMVAIGLVVFEVERSVLSAPWTVIAFVLATIGVSWLSLRWIEKPARRWLRRVLKPKTSQKPKPVLVS